MIYNMDFTYKEYLLIILFYEYYDYIIIVIMYIKIYHYF